MKQFIYLDRRRLNTMILIWLLVIRCGNYLQANDRAVNLQRSSLLFVVGVTSQNILAITGPKMDSCKEHLRVVKCKTPCFKTF